MGAPSSWFLCPFNMPPIFLARPPFLAAQEYYRLILYFPYLVSESAISPKSSGFFYWRNQDLGTMYWSVTSYRPSQRIKLGNIFLYTSLHSHLYPYISPSVYIYLKKSLDQGLPWWFRGLNSTLALQGAWLWSLIGELRSYLPWVVTRKKKNHEFIVMLPIPI